MPRNLDADNSAAIVAPVTAPRWFVTMGFDSPVRLTNGETITWSAQGGIFTQADIEVAFGDKPRITIFNEALAFGAIVLNEGTAGRSISIWQAYQADGATSSLATYAEPVLLFQGEMADATIGDYVQINCRRTAPLFTPRTYVGAPIFNHLPKRGTVIVMPNQKITLE